MNLNGIKDAYGMEQADRDVLAQLVDLRSTMAARNALLDAYYESRQPTPSIGVDNVPENVDPHARCDWARKAVTSVSERVRMDGFVFEGGGADEAFDAVQRDSGLSLAFNRTVASELTHGCAFATVQRTTSGRVAVRMHTAETSAALWDHAEGRVGAGMVVADRRRTSWSPRTPVPVQVHLHLPRSVVVVDRTGPVSWRASKMPTPVDRPMMEAFCFRPTGTKPLGQSRITPAVMYLVDEVERTLRYMAISSALYSAPMMVANGLTEEQYDDMTGHKWSLYTSSWLAATRDENGDTATFEKIAASSPQPYIDAIAAYAKLFSGATGVPLNSLGVVQDNPSSAEAIAASREDVCVAAEDCIESARESMRQVAVMAMAVASNTTPDGLTERQRSVVPHFRSPLMPSVAASADAMVKIAGVLDGFAQTRAFLAGMGFDESEIKDIRAEIDGARAKGALRAIMGSQQPQEKRTAGADGMEGGGGE